MTTTYFRYLPIVLFAFLFLKACGTSDTVTTVGTSPVTVASDTADEDEDDVFRQLNVGLLEPVTNLDPLFADNLSSQRAASLIYEPLFTLDRNGDPRPAFASEVEVSDDGLEYLITINRDLFYHESQAFPAGMGRRVHAADVKYSLQRTARADVPTHAAQLLMNVHGYQNYYLERRYVKETDRHVVDGVSGIEVIDAGTVLIALKREDPDFLMRLASPFLSIVPQEAVQRGETGLKSAPVGTGPFTLTSTQDKRYILTRDDRDSATARENHPKLNRIDLYHSRDEGELFQMFARNEIHLIPEIGPQMLAQISTTDYTLRSTYHGQFNMVRNDAERMVSFNINDNAEIDLSWLKNRLNDTDADSFNRFGEIHLDSLDVSYIGDASSEYYSTFTNDPFARNMLRRLSEEVVEPESRLRLLDIWIATPETALYPISTDSHFSELTETGNSAWITLRSPIVSIYRPNVEGIQAGAAPWLIYPREIRVTDNNRDPS